MSDLPMIVWLCSYRRDVGKWSFADFACNPDNPRGGVDCDERCGWYRLEADE